MIMDSLTERTGLTERVLDDMRKVADYHNVVKMVWNEFGKFNIERKIQWQFI